MLDDDPVNRPKHYQLGELGVEVIDVRDALLDKIETAVWLNARQIDYWSRAWEYITRAMDKNGLEDLEKGAWYLNRLIDDLKKNGS